MVSDADRSHAERLRSIELHLDAFARDALDSESARLGVSAEELLTFSLLYYLADVDSGRIAREIGRSPLSPAPGRPADRPT
jgi:hypothetical protein